MFECDNFDYTTAKTGDFMVSVSQEMLDSVDDNHSLWGYCLRIENNSNMRIHLLKKDFCFTNDNGDSLYDMSLGFNGELPDLGPGETFEFEDTAFIEGKAAVLYGSCVAANDDGAQIAIKLPLIELNSLKNHSSLKGCFAH